MLPQTQNGRVGEGPIQPRISDPTVRRLRCVPAIPIDGGGGLGAGARSGLAAQGTHVEVVRPVSAAASVQLWPEVKSYSSQIAAYVFNYVGVKEEYI